MLHCSNRADRQADLCPNKDVSAFAKRIFKDDMMFPWFCFHPTLNLPWSGDVHQDIEPRTIWDLPFSGPYRGDRALERRILAEGAGYGEQLDVLFEALQALVQHQKAEKLSGCREALDLYKTIETIKKAHYAEKVDDIRAALDRLKQSDEKAYRSLLDELS